MSEVEHVAWGHYGGLWPRTACLHFSLKWDDSDRVSRGGQVEANGRNLQISTLELNQMQFFCSLRSDSPPESQRHSEFPEIVTTEGFPENILREMRVFTASPSSHG